MIVWGSTFIVTKILLEESGPYLLSTSFLPWDVRSPDA
jgi:hypothetical protein